MWGELGVPLSPDPALSLLSSQVASKAGVYEILNSLGFPEFEGEEQLPFSRLRCRWQEQRGSPESLVAGDFL